MGEISLPEEKNNKPGRKPSIGGQAVLEGVMMKSPEYMAIAVRKESGEINVHVEQSPPLTAKYKFMGWPVIRGVVNFCMMLSSGMKSINQASDMLGITDTDEPSRFEKWLTAKLGDKTEKVLIGFAMVVAVVIAAGLFVVLPSLAATFCKRYIESAVLINTIEGLLRIALFIGYIAAISLMKDINRVFAYHGAEHKTVHCYEHDEELTVENARKFSTLHPRCGTSFLFIVMAISIVFFSLFGWNANAFTRVFSRLMLLPVVAGFSYEALRLLALNENALVRVLRAPGMLLQKLTTREPDDEMLEVAIASFKAAESGKLEKKDDGENMPV